jgi:hypothetical protein
MSPLGRLGDVQRAQRTLSAGAPLALLRDNGAADQRQAAPEDVPAVAIRRCRSRLVGRPRLAGAEVTATCSAIDLLASTAGSDRRRNLSSFIVVMRLRSRQVFRRAALAIRPQGARDRLRLLDSIETVVQEASRSLNHLASSGGTYCWMCQHVKTMLGAIAQSIRLALGSMPPDLSRRTRRLDLLQRDEPGSSRPMFGIVSTDHRRDAAAAILVAMANSR